MTVEHCQAKKKPKMAPQNNSGNTSGSRRNPSVVILTPPADQRHGPHNARHADTRETCTTSQPTQSVILVTACEDA